MLYHIRAGEIPLLIRKTAKELCGEFYELARTDYFRLVNKDEKHRKPVKQKEFIRHNWDKYVPTAIDVLAAMLQTKDLPEDQKEAIYEALVQFNDRQHINCPGYSWRVFQ